MSLSTLLENNRRWAKKIVEKDEKFFERLDQQQKPQYLWIGCADSRVPATEIVDLLPGEMFVHRNVANLVIHTDLNCLSVIQYAVDVLKVKHIIVCGHYGCGGVKAAIENQNNGLIDNWLQSIKDIQQKYEDKMLVCKDEKSCFNTLCELNVLEQVVNVSQTTVLRNAWERGQKCEVHGWIYGIQDGHIHDLDITIDRTANVALVKKQSLSTIFENVL